MAFFQIVEIPEFSAWEWAKEELEGLVITCNKKDVVSFEHLPEGKYFDPCKVLTGDNVLKEYPHCIFAVCKRLPGSNL